MLPLLVPHSFGDTVRAPQLAVRTAAQLRTKTQQCVPLDMAIHCSRPDDTARDGFRCREGRGAMAGRRSRVCRFDGLGLTDDPDVVVVVRGNGWEAADSDADVHGWRRCMHWGASVLKP